MAQWQPKRTMQERNTRALRSMQNGTLDGRVLGSPVRFNPNSIDFGQEGDEGGLAGEDSLTLLPFTDVFNPPNASTLTFTLTFAPWSQPEMTDFTRNKASIHLYWNGVYQRDLTYSLSGRILTVFNDSMQIRAGDSISVKYFYEESAAEDNATTLYRMECWLETVPTGDSGGLWNDRFKAGAVSSPPLGQNAGTLKVVSTRFKTYEFLPTWSSRWRLPKGMVIPTDDTVESISWLLYYDEGASVSLSTDGLYPNRIGWTGTNIGQTVGGQGSCLGAFALCDPDEEGYVVCNPTSGKPCTLCWQKGWGWLPDVLRNNPGTAGSPSPGPTSGKTFSSGQDAIELAKRANAWVAGSSSNEHLSFGVEFGVPKRGPGPGGCSWDDTIVGPFDYDVAAYDVKIGVTCVVVRKA